ncbi:hypothetical protein ScPMuIL_005073 [Solemya velum]
MRENSPRVLCERHREPMERPSSQRNLSIYLTTNPAMVGKVDIGVMSETRDHFSQDLVTKRLKSQMEDELLIRLGVKKEKIEWNPLILAEKLKRMKSNQVMDYKAVAVGRGDTRVLSNPAVKQMSYVSVVCSEEFYMIK